LLGNRNEFRLGEEIAKIFTKPLIWLKLLKSVRPIYDHQVAKSMVKKAIADFSNPVEIVLSSEMQDLTR
jgi:hypothetical protein